MKKTFRMMSLALGAGLVMLTSCSKDDDKKNGNGGSAQNGAIVAKVDGTNFSSVESKTYVHYAHSLNNLYFYGTDSNDITVGFEIKNFDGEAKTYEISESNPDVMAFYNVQVGQTFTNWNAPYVGSGVAGELIITEFSSLGVLKGTFHFKGGKDGEAGDIKNLTNGSFNLSVDEGF